MTPDNMGGPGWAGHSSALRVSLQAASSPAMDEILRQLTNVKDVYFYIKCNKVYLHLNIMTKKDPYLLYYG